MARLYQDDANGSGHALLFYRYLMQPLLNIGMRAARRAGDLIVRSLSRLDSVKIDTKGRNDFVTDIDRKAEAEIIATIRRSHPDHAFLAEESGRGGGDSEFVWIIDPLDGTTNFLHGFPTFAVSIALQHRGRLQQAVVYDPMRQEFFTASRGDGAQLEGKKIRVSSQRTLEGSLIGTGFPYRMEAAHIDDYLAMLKVIMGTAAGVRRPGAAALDLAYVAAGRIDGFWEFGLAPWDTAAGTLLIQEAGGRVGTPAGAEYALGPNIVAGNPKVYQGLLDALGPLTPPALRS
jgi:myo-inositol-1(or 4)-monophosphatase